MKGNLELLKNPLHYYCAANAATPDYVLTDDAHAFLAWMCFCATQGWTEEVEAHDDYGGFVMDVQSGVLELAKIAVDMMFIAFKDHAVPECEDIDVGSDHCYSVPGVEDAEYQLRAQIRCDPVTNVKQIVFIDGVISNTIDTDDHVSWWQINVHEPHWHLDLLAVIDSAKDELEMRHNRYKGIKVMPSRIRGR